MTHEQSDKHGDEGGHDSAQGGPWLPFTFRGVAGLALKERGRLAIVQWVVALIVSAVLMISARMAWFPVVAEAIEKAPASARIRGGRLEWPGNQPVLLGRNAFLAIAVDHGGGGGLGATADLEVVLGARAVRLRSLLGFIEVPYTPRLEIDLSRSAVEPWWGAWRIPLLALLGAGSLLWLFIVWSCLAFLYAPVVRTISFYADRDVSVAAPWRVASAALLPGALFLAVAMVGHAVGRLSLIQFLAAGAMHIVIGWIFVAGAPFALPRNKAADGGTNPFRPESDSTGDQRGEKKSRTNPFA